MVARPHDNALRYLISTFRDGMMIRPKNIYVLWAELFPSLLVDDRTREPIPTKNLKAQASKYARKSRQELCLRLPVPKADARGGHGEAGHGYAGDASAWPTYSNGELLSDQELVRRVLGVLQPAHDDQHCGDDLMALELMAQFYDAWRLCGCDASHFFHALEESCGLGILFSHSFLTQYLQCVQCDFAGATERDMHAFAQELGHLPRLLQLRRGWGMEACRKVFFDAVALLFVGALGGPRSYVGEMGYTLPGSVQTPRMVPSAALGARPSSERTGVDEAQVVAVVLRDTEARHCYVQGVEPVRVRAGQTILLGRDRHMAANAASTVFVVTSFAMASRLHAAIRWQDGSWVLVDGGRDGRGSTYGTLVVHASGSREFCQGSAVTLRDGDVVCLAPRADADEHVPAVGCEDAAYRFEVICSR